MNIFASVGRGLGSWLGLPSRNSIGLSAATASLSLGEAHLPGSRPVTLIAAPTPAAPVASAIGGELRRGNPPELDQHIRAIGGMSVKDFMAAASQVRAQASRGTAARAGASRPAVLAKAAPPALDDDGVAVEVEKPADPENPPGVDSIISQLLDLLTELQKQVQSTDDDNAEIAAAIGHYRAGRKLTASRSLMAIGKKLCERPKLTPQGRIARGYNAQSGVQAIQAVLRPGPRPAPAPVSTAAASAPPIPLPSDRVAKVAALRAERAALETSMQRSGRYDNKMIVRQQQITGELKRLGAR